MNSVCSLEGTTVLSWTEFLHMSYFVCLTFNLADNQRCFAKIPLYKAFRLLTIELSD